MLNPIELVDHKNLVKLVKTLISIPSITGQEQELADWVYDYFTSVGMSDIKRFPVKEAGDTIAGWINKDVDGPTIMLNFHLDTFDVFKGWKTDPYTPLIKNGCLYGLGSHDMKGGAACILEAIEAIIKSRIKLRGRVLVTATSDEENWSRGAHEIIKSGLLNDCKYCLVPEPSPPASVTIGQRGRHVFHLTFHGKTVSAAYEGGINAIVDATRVVNVLSYPNEIDLGYNEEFGLSGSLCIIGFHSGGTMILVPEIAEVFIDRHILPGQTVEEAADQIRVAVEKANILGQYELTWDERPTPAPTSFLVPSSSKFVQVVKNNLEQELGYMVELILGRSVADTNHFAVYGGVPTLIYGPQGGNTCEANEFVNIESLSVVTRTYIRSVVDLLGICNK